MTFEAALGKRFIKAACANMSQLTIRSSNQQYKHENTSAVF